LSIGSPASAKKIKTMMKKYFSLLEFEFFRVQLKFAFRIRPYAFNSLLFILVLFLKTKDEHKD